jgi:hypothetical protein
MFGRSVSILEQVFGTEDVRVIETRASYESVRRVLQEAVASGF